MMSRVKILTAVLALSALGLSACSTFGKSAEDRTAEREANPGPCPRAFSLYDTSRLAQINGAESFENVGFTGEIDQVRSLCRYFGSAPIDADLELDMRFGRGPAADGDTHTYYYFVAVTRKNVDVIEKEYFPVTVTFPPGVDQVSLTERIDSIVIPRAKDTTSGANFEIITGFDLTPDQLAFNQAGKRFRVSAGQ